MNISQATERLHNIITALTYEITPDQIKDEILVRRKMSVFTYGVCVAMANGHGLDAEVVYLNYLLKGGLKKHQAQTVVERTSHKFIYEDFGKECYSAGNQIDVDAFNENDVFDLKRLIFGL